MTDVIESFPRKKIASERLKYLMVVCIVSYIFFFWIKQMKKS